MLYIGRTLYKYVDGIGSRRRYEHVGIVQLQVGGGKSQSRTETWLAKGVGEVKSVTYDKKGKVLSTVELTAVE